MSIYVVMEVFVVVMEVFVVVIWKSLSLSYGSLFLLVYLQDIDNILHKIFKKRAYMDYMLKLYQYVTRRIRSSLFKVV